jgi:hypothetical protein
MHFYSQPDLTLQNARLLHSVSGEKRRPRVEVVSSSRRCPGLSPQLTHLSSITWNVNGDWILDLTCRFRHVVIRRCIYAHRR